MLKLANFWHGDLLKALSGLLNLKIVIKEIIKLTVSCQSTVGKVFSLLSSSPVRTYFRK